MHYQPSLSYILCSSNPNVKTGPRKSNGGVRAQNSVGSIASFSPTQAFLNLTDILRDYYCLPEPRKQPFIDSFFERLQIKAVFTIIFN